MTPSEAGKVGGKATLYKEEYAEQAYNACLLWGATNKQLAKFFGVTTRTIEKWQVKHKAFGDAMRDGKAVADSKVARALFERATGYEHHEDKIFLHEGQPVIVPTTKCYPPDTAAAMKWLHNRQREHWREKIEIGQTDSKGKDVKPGGLVIVPADADPEEWLKRAVHVKDEE